MYLRAHRASTPWRSVRRVAFVSAVVLGAVAWWLRGGVAPSWWDRALSRPLTGLGAVAESLGARVRGWWHGDAAHSAEALRQELAAAQAALAGAEECRLERDRLRAMLQLGGLVNAAPRAARVVLHELRAPYKIVVIDQGAADGVVRGMPVIAAQGLVGRVERVAAHQSTVLLLADPTHAVDVVTQRARTRGILLGRGDALTLGRPTGVTRIEYLHGDADLADGDVVVTSGLDGRYPSGLPVGAVRRVERTADGRLTSAEVVPFVDWGAIELVSLLPASHP